MHLIVGVEVVANKGQAQCVDDCLDSLFEFGVASAWVAVGGGEQAWAFPHCFTPRSAHCPHGVIARNSNSGFAQAVDE